MAGEPYPTCTPRRLGAFDRLRGGVERIRLLTRYSLALLHDRFERQRCWRRARAGEREMMALDDRLLRDIGLKRSEIHAAAYGLLQKDPPSAVSQENSTKR
jgi:uncharacterized protein YjiS (DUF1127 family)